MSDELKISYVPVTNTVELPVAFNPKTAFPLDARSIFGTLEAAQNAAAEAENAGSSNTVYYYGQTLTVFEEGVAKFYIIQGDNTLKEVGSDIDLSGYATKDDIKDFITQVPDEYVTESELQEKGYLTAVPDEYVTNTELEEKGYVTDISGKADLVHTHTLSQIRDYVAPEIPTKVSQLENDSNFLTAVPDEYVTEEELNAKGYAKSSELFSKDYNDLTNKPTNVSQFTNDVGYLVASDISNKADKSELPTKTSELSNDSGFITISDAQQAANAVKDELLNGAGEAYDTLKELGDLITDNVDAIDALNEVAAEKADKIHEHPQYLTEHQSLEGYAKTNEIPTKVSDLTNDSGYLTAVPAEYVTENELQDKGYLTEQSLTDYAKKSELPTTTSQLTNDSGYITSIPDEYVTNSELEAKGYLTEHQSLDGYAKTGDLPTKTSDLTNDSGYITSIPDEYVTESELEGKGYLTEHQSLEDYAKTSQLPTKVSELTNDSGYLTSVPDEYVTETELEGKGYLTQHQSLADYAKKSELPTVTSQLTNDSGYLTSIPEEYVTESELEGKGYLTEHQSLADYAKKDELFSKDYNDLVNTPQLPTKVTQLENDAKYVTLTELDEKLVGKTDYLGTVATVDDLSTTAGRGDFYRVSAEFTLGDETAHVGDVLIALVDNPTVIDWDLIHTELDKDTWTENTVTAAGYVAKGEGNPNKVWATDENGNPAWREDNKVAIANAISGLYTIYGKRKLATEGELYPEFEDGSECTFHGAYYPNSKESFENGNRRVVMYGKKGTFSVDMAEDRGDTPEDKHVTNRKWVTDNFRAVYEPTTAGANYFYRAFKKADGSYLQDAVQSTVSPKQYTLIERDVNGRAKINDPVDNLDIANKGYVDALEARIAALEEKLSNVATAEDIATIFNKEA